MKSGKKTVLKVILGILAVFSLLNVSWYIWRMVKYDAYCKGMEKTVFATWIVPRYKHVDADGYDYGVKYPEYLSFTGNMSVGLPAKDDNPFTDFLIVWPKVSGKYEYGVSLTEGRNNYQIYINSDGSAVHPEDREVVARFRESINELLRRAKSMWDLE